MHPGPVNRGVELSGEVVDSPQAVITAQVEAGVVVRMAVLYEVLTAHPPARVEPARARAGAGMTPRAPRHRRPRDLVVRGAHVLDPRAGIDGAFDVVVRRRAARRARARRQRRRARGRRGRRRRRAATCCRPSSTRTCTCACPARSTRRTSRPAPAPPPPAASARSWRCPTPTRWSTARPCCAPCATPPRATRACPSASWPRSRAGLRGEELTEMAELRDEGALGFTDDGKPVVSRRDAAQGAAVPAPGRRRCSRCTRRTRAAQRPRRDARGRGQRAARRRRHPERRASRRWSPATARSPATRAGASTSSTSVVRRVGRGGRGGQGGRRAGHLRGLAAPPRASPTRRSAASTRG